MRAHRALLFGAALLMAGASALVGGVATAGPLPGAAPRIASSAGDLRSEVAATAARLASATAEWERGQAQLGIAVQRRVQLERELAAVHETARRSSDNLAGFAAQLYRNPMNPLFTAVAAGDARLMTDVMYLQRRTNATAAGVREAADLLATRAARVEALLKGQEQAARAVTKLQKGQQDKLERLLADVAEAQSRLKRHLDELRAREAAARANGAACSSGIPAGTVNGFLPPSALCWLQTAPGHRLGMDAARAFDAMSTAFRADFGKPLCVTDSYRDYAGQVDVFQRKPSLAATPGRSNHGWGVAVDLCGGVQSFGSPEHVWLQQNAAQFGWGHPAWAEPDGSRPEAWHWEFQG